MFFTNKKLSALSVTFFKKEKRKKNIAKKCNFKNFSKSLYFLLGYCRNVSFGSFWEAKMQFLKNVV